MGEGRSSGQTLRLRQRLLKRPLDATHPDWAVHDDSQTGLNAHVMSPKKRGPAQRLASLMMTEPVTLFHWLSAFARGS